MIHVRAPRRRAGQIEALRKAKKETVAFSKTGKKATVSQLQKEIENLRTLMDE